MAHHEHRDWGRWGRREGPWLGWPAYSSYYPFYPPHPVWPWSPGSTSSVLIMGAHGPYGTPGSPWGYSTPPVPIPGYAPYAMENWDPYQGCYADARGDCVYDPTPAGWAVGARYNAGRLPVAAHPGSQPGGFPQAAMLAPSPVLTIDHPLGVVVGQQGQYTRDFWGGVASVSLTPSPDPGDQSSFASKYDGATVPTLVFRNAPAAVVYFVNAPPAMFHGATLSVFGGQPRLGRP